MTFEALGDVTFGILEELTKTRVGALDLAVVTDRVEKSAGEIERVAWLWKTDQARRIDASLLTENRELYGVLGEGEERTRQAHLLERVLRIGGKRAK